jgi:hypothetical protein
MVHTVSMTAAPPEAPLSARVCDPAGPFWWRALVTIGIMPVAMVGAILPWSATLNIVCALTAVAWLVLVRLFVGRLKPRACQIRLRPGEIRVTHAGAASQRIHAQQIRAASTARLGNTFSLGLVRNRHDDPPLWLELSTAEDVERVRRALGVGHSGFGQISFPPRRGTFHGRRTPVDLFAVAAWLATLAAVGAESWVLAFFLGVAFVTLTAVGASFAIAGRGRYGVFLAPSSLGTLQQGMTGSIAWGDVVAAEATPEALVIRTMEGSQVVPLPHALPAEREHLVAQIESAAQRARGLGPLPPSLPTSLALLVPRGEEDTRAWIERVDATASTLAAGEGYRQSGVDERELWETLENADAPSPMRAAAARILARVAPEQAGPRIAQVLVREHDENVRIQIRVALEEDVEVAARAFDRLDR